MLSGFGCRILAYDKFPNEEVKKYATYVDGPTFARESDIITLHCPLTPETRHILNEETLPYLKDGVFIINTSRGALLDTAKVIQFLKSGKIGYLAIDVYEEEADYFYSDLSDKVPTNDELARLLTFPNVLVTSHMAFLTDHALCNIAEFGGWGGFTTQDLKRYRFMARLTARTSNGWNLLGRQAQTAEISVRANRYLEKRLGPPSGNHLLRLHRNPVGSWRPSPS